MGGDSAESVVGVCKHTGLLQVLLLASVTASPRPSQIAHVNVGYTKLSGTLQALNTKQHRRCKRCFGKVIALSQGVACHF